MHPYRFILPTKGSQNVHRGIMNRNGMTNRRRKKRKNKNAIM
jgi:hypothetical protein